MAPEYVVFMPTLTEYYEQILRETRTLSPRPSNWHRDIARLRPAEASHLAWVTSDELAVRRLSKLGAIITPRTGPRGLSDPPTAAAGS